MLYIGYLMSKLHQRVSREVRALYSGFTIWVLAGGRGLGLGFFCLL